MVLFGGYYQTADDRDLYIKVWYYSFDDKKWEIVKDIELDFHCEPFVLTNNQRYIIIF